MRKMSMVFVLVVACFMLSGCGQDLKFWGSHWQSSMTGLRRHITVYTWNGTKIGEFETTSKIEWTGDHQASFFDANNKRVDVTGDVIFVAQEI